MSFMPAFMLPMWRSVEIESGRKPCRTAGTATRHAKLLPPWPTSKITPRSRPANIMEKLNLHGIPELMLYAIRKGVIS